MRERERDSDRKRRRNETERDRERKVIDVAKVFSFLVVIDHRSSTFQPKI